MNAEDQKIAVIQNDISYIKDAIKSIQETFKEMSDNKSDKEMCDRNLKSIQGDVSEIRATAERFYQETVKLQGEVLQQKNELCNAIEKFNPVKKAYDRLAAASLGFMALIGTALIGSAFYIYEHIVKK